MKRKIAAFLTTVACLIGMQVLIAPPSSADVIVTKQRCSSDGAVCMQIKYINETGDFGWYIYWVYLWCDNRNVVWNWDHPAVDGHYIKLYKNPYTTNTVVWSRDDSDSNVDTTGNSGHPCNRTININQDWPSADSMKFFWAFTEQKDWRPDVSDDITVSLEDASD